MFFPLSLQYQMEINMFHVYWLCSMQHVCQMVYEPNQTRDLILLNFNSLNVAIYTQFAVE